jgi:hypothetical protein
MLPMGIVRLSPVVGDLSSEPIPAPGPMDVDTFSNMVNHTVNMEEQLAPVPLVGPHHVDIRGIPHDPAPLPLTPILPTHDTPDVIDMTVEVSCISIVLRYCGRIGRNDDTCNLQRKAAKLRHATS